MKTPNPPQLLKEKKKYKYEIKYLNTILGIIGLTGVWFTTHNLWAIFWAFIGALHLTFISEREL